MRSPASDSLPLASPRSALRFAANRLFAALGLAAAALLFDGLAATAEAGTFPVTTGAELNVVRNRARASQFLQRATFGPTWEEIDALAVRIGQIGRNAAFEEWIDQQFQTAPTYHKPLALQMIAADGLTPTQRDVNIVRHRQHAWWHSAIAGEDQLRQRVAWAMAQIFVINDGALNDPNPGPLGEAKWLGGTNYYDMLLENAFGNYRDTLYDVSLHPVMGVFLTHVHNRKANPAIGRYPDENYAREVMQLFSIGVNRLRLNGTVVTYRSGPKAGQPVETYDNDDIETFARVFTGLKYGNDNGRFYSPRTYKVPMAMWEPEHDTDEKTLLRGTVLPAGQPGLDDINGALDNLFEHPNTGPFIARRLIQRLVKSNPSKGYIRRVAKIFNDNGAGVRGDWKAVIKAVLMDNEALNSLRFVKQYETVDGKNRLVGLSVVGRGTEWSRLREPVTRYTALMRQFDAASDYPNGYFMLRERGGDFNQNPFDSPSVFNFYLPDYKPSELIGYQTTTRIPDGELFAPEFQIMTTVSANKLANRFNWDTVDGEVYQWVYRDTGGNAVENRITLDLSDEIALKDDLWGLLDRLDLLLCHGSMSDEAKATVVTAMQDHPITWNDLRYVAFGTLLVMTSPDCAVSE